nr:ATP-binding protein [arsenite-oxidising bacterium NT-25]
MNNGSGGRHDSHGLALSAQPGESRRRPVTNTSSQLINDIGLPHLRAPGASVPDAHTIDADLLRHHPIERLNGEIKRRTEVAGMFPNDNAIVHLVSALLP